MSNLADILQNPDYINANAATKQAIFDKHAPQDPNYANANPATQSAIQSKFGLTIAAPTQEEKTVLGFGGNVITSAGHLVKGLAEAVTSPIQTGTTMLQLLGGAYYHALPKRSQDAMMSISPDQVQTMAKIASTVGGQYAKDYGSVEGLKNKIYADPVGFLADASLLLTGGGSALVKGAELTTKTAPAAVLAAGIQGTTQGGRIGGAITSAAELSAPVVGAMRPAADLAAQVGTAAQKVGATINPLNPIIKGAQLAAPVIAKPFEWAYNIIEPIVPGGAAAIQARAVLSALNNDPATIARAKELFDSGKTIEQVAVELKNPALAAVAKDVRDVNNAIQQKYNARGEAVYEGQANQLAGAGQNLNQLAAGVAPTVPVGATAPRTMLNTALTGEGAALAQQQAARTGALTAEQQAAEAALAQQQAARTGVLTAENTAAAEANAAEQAALATEMTKASPLATGETIAERAAAGRKTVTKEVIDPAYKAAFDLSKGVEIPFANVLGVAKDQLGSVVTTLGTEAPQAAAAIRAFTPAQPAAVAGKVAEVVPATVTLEQAHELNKALNRDLRDMYSAAAPNLVAISRAKETISAIKTAIADSGLSQETKAAYAEAQRLFGTAIGDVYDTGKISQAARGATTPLKEARLNPETTVSDFLSSERDMRQALKALKSDPAAMQAVKTGVEDNFRLAVVKNGVVDSKAAAAYLQKHEFHLQQLDDVGMNMTAALKNTAGRAGRLEETGATLTAQGTAIPSAVKAEFKNAVSALAAQKKTIGPKVSAEFAAQDAALKLATQQLGHATTESLVAAVIKDPNTLGAALSRLGSGEKIALAREVVQTALSPLAEKGGGAKALKYIDDNQTAIARVLRAADSKGYAKLLTDIKQTAEVQSLFESANNALAKTKPATSNALAASKRLDTLTQSLPEARAVIEKIQSELATGATFEELAAQGRKAGASGMTLVSDAAGKPFASLNPKGMVFNLIMNRVKGGLDVKAAVNIADALVDSASASALISKSQAYRSKSQSARDVVGTDRLEATSNMLRRAALPAAVVQNALSP